MRNREQYRMLYITWYSCKSKGKGSHNRLESPDGGRGIALHLLDIDARRDGWSASRLGGFIPGKDSVPIVQEDGWALGTVWTCAKNLVPTGIRAPDRPARSQSLYQLSYPGPRNFLGFLYYKIHPHSRAVQFHVFFPNPPQSNITPNIYYLLLRLLHVISNK
jgi:hypothetical protein